MKDNAVVSDKVRHLRYESLRKRLKEEQTWPLLYQHKMIGKNLESFRNDIKNYQEVFPRLNVLEKSESRNGTYLSVTYEILARDVDEIISLWVEGERLKDIVTIL